jgi:regulator of cell morphogenesis and NO signaling
MTIQPPADAMRMRHVGEIASTVPGATAVFRRFRLDFCCHGELSLEAAAARRGIDPAEVEQALAALGPTDATTPVASMSSSELIDHIETCYHDAHRHDLPELMALARKVEAVHREHPKVPNGLFSTLEEMQGELESHMRVEETTLFPMMRVETPAELGRAIGALRHEHDDQARLLHRLESLTDNFTLPEGACRSWQALYVSTAQFVADVMEHIHLENNVLFPRFAETEARAEG